MRRARVIGYGRAPDDTAERGRAHSALWAEQRLYFQVLFAFDRVKALAPQHPKWKDKEPFTSLLNSDVNASSPGVTRHWSRTPSPRTRGFPCTA